MASEGNSVRSKRNKYENYCAHLASHFDVQSTREEFYASNEIVFKCKRVGHEIRMKVTSMGNKMSFLKDLDLWCDACNKESRWVAKTKAFAMDLEEKVGHSIATVDWSSRRVEYTCVNCGETRHNYVHNLKRKDATGRCDKCQNDDRRIPYERLKVIVNSFGKTLLTKADEYESNKQKLEIVCECGRTYGCRLVDIKRGKKCSQCLYDRQRTNAESTCMKTYGVRNPMNVPEIMEKVSKAGYTTKKFCLPSGSVVNVQGYEPYAITHLLSHGIEETDMAFGQEVPLISYNDSDGKEHTYYPDLFLRSSNTIVEVKSLHTLVKEFELNRLKWLATVEKGFPFCLFLFDDKGTRIGEYRCESTEEVEKMMSQF